MNKKKFEPFKPKGRAHPSGQSRPPQNYKRQGFMRIPQDGPVVPRLQQRGFTHAIGFHSQLVADEDDE